MGILLSVEQVTRQQTPLFLGVVASVFCSICAENLEFFVK